jgi:hypothetical protein
VRAAAGVGADEDPAAQPAGQLRQRESDTMIFGWRAVGCTRKVPFELVRTGLSTSPILPGQRHFSYLKDQGRAAARRKPEVSAGSPENPRVGRLHWASDQSAQAGQGLGTDPVVDPPRQRALPRSWRRSARPGGLLRTRISTLVGYR